tara:strand:+ start:198 stop:425 length:228 start_codon:yes stop_codon:yes gene_type:complete
LTQLLQTQVAVEHQVCLGKTHLAVALVVVEDIQHTQQVEPQLKVTQAVQLVLVLLAVLVSIMVGVQVQAVVVQVQ